MEIHKITQNTISKVSNKELVNMHYRIHQQYSLAKKKNDKQKMTKLKEKHEIVVKEMKKRGINHNSILENYLANIQKGI